MAIDRGCIYEKYGQFKSRSTGQPLDVSTWQFETALKDESGATVLTMTTAGGHFTVTNGPEGEIKISLTEAETTALTAGRVSGVLYRTDDGRRRYGRFSEYVRDPE